MYWSDMFAPIIGSAKTKVFGSLANIVHRRVDPHLAVWWRWITLSKSVHDDYNWSQTLFSAGFPTLWASWWNEEWGIMIIWLARSTWAKLMKGNFAMLNKSSYIYNERQLEINTIRGVTFTFGGIRLNQTWVSLAPMMYASLLKACSGLKYLTWDQR